MRRTVKRGLGILMTVAVLGLTACSEGSKETESVADAKTEASQEGTSAESTAASTEPVTLRFAWWGNDLRHEAILKAIELYEERNPNVKVEGEYQGYDGYYEKMMTTLSSGTAPDLFQFMRGWLPDVQAAKHYLADLSKLPVDTSTLKGDILDKSGSYKGEPILFPVSVGASIVYVNSDFAEKYSIDLTKEYTWDELKAVGVAVHEQNPEAYLMSADIDVLNKLMLNAYVTQKIGDSMVNEDTYEVCFTKEQMQAGIQNILDYYEAGVIEPFGEAAAFVGQMDQNVKWINGEIGMLIDYTGSYSKYTGSISSPIDVIKIPVTDNAKCSGVSFGGDRGISINDNSAQKEEAAKFLDFLMNDPEAAKILGTNLGYCPTSTSEEALVEIGVVEKMQQKAIELCAQNSYTENGLSSNTSLETIRKDVLEEVIYGDKNAEEGAAEILEGYQSILDELKGNQ